MATSRFNVKEHIIDSAYVREYPRALANSQNDVLKLHVKQYIPKEAPTTSRTITIIGGHANGFPKELYEPFWDELFDRASSHGFEIAGIWIADVAWQGQSSVLNEHLLGNDPSWFDHSRDLLHMINTFRREMPQPIIGIGHSMGGCQITNLALFHPRLFASLILLDPVLAAVTQTGPISEYAPKFGIATLSTHRRDIWPSREEAANSFKKSPFYQSWHPKVLDLWVKYGLRDCPTALHPGKVEAASAPVTLTTPRPQEVWSFLRPNYNGRDKHGNTVINRVTHPDVDTTSPTIYPYYRPESRAVYQRLPNLRPPTYYIFGELSDFGGPDAQYPKVTQTGIGYGGSGGEAEGQVGHVFLKGIGHLVPMEAPISTADHAAKWLQEKLDTWFKHDEEFQKSWSQIPLKDKQNFDKDWLDTIGSLPSKGKKSKL